MGLCQFLAEQHIPFERLVHPPAFTAQKRAHFLHVSGRQVTKSVLLRSAGQYLLAVLPATRHVDTNSLVARFGGPVGLAELREVTELFRDCEWGVVPPFGRLYGVRTVLDASLNPDDDLLCEGQTLSESIRIGCRDFERLEQPLRLGFAGH